MRMVRTNRSRRTFEVLALTVEPSLGAVEALLHDGLAGAQHRDLSGELVDVLGVARDLRREDSLAFARLIELGLLCVELRLEVLPGRRATPTSPAMAHTSTATASMRRRGSTGSWWGVALICGSPTGLADGLALAR